jgi:hypothetical protein
MRRITSVFILFLISFALTAFPLRTAAMNQPLGTVTSCLHTPFKERVESVTLFEKRSLKDFDLYHFAVQLSFASGKESREQYTSYQLVKLSSGKCSLVFSGDQDNGPLHQYFDEALSKDLALSQYRYKIKKEGKVSIQRLLSSRNLILPREQAWALRQLGFNVPKGVEDVK